jgi:hypothetical protein
MYRIPRQTLHTMKLFIFFSLNVTWSSLQAATYPYNYDMVVVYGKLYTVQGDYTWHVVEAFERHEPAMTR